MPPCVCVTVYMPPWVYTRVVYLSGVYQGGYTSQVCTREAIPRVYIGWYIPRVYNGWYIPSVYRVVVYTQGGGVVGIPRVVGVVGIPRV